VEVTDKREPGIWGDGVRIELINRDGIVEHEWAGSLEGDNIQVKEKGPEVELPSP